MRYGEPLIIVGAVVAVIAGAGAGVRLAVTADPVRRARAREAAAAAAQYGLLFGFAAVAAAISAHGLVGFARASMDLRGAWPYLLWGALDGAAGLCAVLLMRRAARGESALAPRLAVWGLVAASGLFNWTHAPDHPGARVAFALMPVIAAMLFEFSLRETRHLARGAGRRLAGLGWLRPGERVRVWLLLAADATMSAETATRWVRVDRAARRLLLLRQVLAARERAAGPHAVADRRVRRADQRAQAALVRARFADPGVAADVLRQVQVLTLTQVLAGLDYSTPDHARAALASLITPGPGSDGSASGQAGLVRLGRRPGVVRDVALGWCPDGPGIDGAAGVHAGWAVSGGDGPRVSGNGHRACDRVAAAPRPGPREPGRDDSPLIAAAARIVAETRVAGGGLSQAELARRLRAGGFSIANDRLRWLSAVSGLQPEAAER